jgi:hypothetical protein
VNGDTVIAFLAALGTFLAAFGVKDIIGKWATRRGDRADAAAADRKQVTVVEAQGNLDVLKVLLTETKNRVDGYEKAIADLKASHTADIRELKVENKSLERQVNDLRLALQDYQLGNRVPRGMVLVPVREVKRIRESHPGLLEQRWYPGELEGSTEGPPGPGVDGRSIVARVTRLDGPDGSP